jgi:hypothetical protein
MPVGKTEIYPRDYTVFIHPITTACSLQWRLRKEQDYIPVIPKLLYIATHLSIMVSSAERHKSCTELPIFSN